MTLASTLEVAAQGCGQGPSAVASPRTTHKAAKVGQLEQPRDRFNLVRVPCCARSLKSGRSAHRQVRLAEPASDLAYTKFRLVSMCILPQAG